MLRGGGGGAAHRVHDLALLLLGEGREHRQRQPLSGRRLRLGQRSLAVAEMAEHRLQMLRLAVVGGRGHAGILERALQLFAARRAHHVQVVDVGATGGLGRQQHVVAQPQLAVAGGGCAPALIPAVHLGQEAA
jgi:hypothetical protein